MRPAARRRSAQTLCGTDTAMKRARHKGTRGQGAERNQGTGTRAEPGDRPLGVYPIENDHVAQAAESGGARPFPAVIMCLCVDLRAKFELGARNWERGRGRGERRLRHCMAMNNPVGVGTAPPTKPRVGAARQPWATDSAPLGQVEWGGNSRMDDEDSAAASGPISERGREGDSIRSPDFRSKARGVQGGTVGKKGIDSTLSHV